MNQNKFSKLENNYYYGISRVFWHIIIALGSFAIIAGIAVLIWSQIPASKNKVIKENAPSRKSYPQPIGVSLSELINTLPKGKEELEKTKNNITQATETRSQNIEVVENEDEARDTVGLYKFNTQIDILKTLIPVSENSNLWESQGHYYFNSSKDERMFKRTGRESLRHWNATSSGFEQNFIKKTDYKKYNLKSYSNKAILLASFNDLIKNADKKNRVSLLKRHLILMNFYSKKGLEESVRFLKTTATITKHIDSKEQMEAFKTLSSFFYYNPKDGLGLQKFQEDILQGFESDKRLDIIKIINREYRENYDFQLASIIDNTRQFIPMLSNFKGDQQPVALKNFYKLFKRKNKNRNQKIQQIDSEYQSEIRKANLKHQNNLANAEADFFVKKAKKSSMKWLSLQSMAYGLGVVLLISLILLILSMIRNVNRLAEAMLKNNK